MRSAIQFELGGKEFRLVPDFEALSLIEESVSRPIFQVVQALLDGEPRLSELVMCIHAGRVAAGEKAWAQKDMGNFLLKHRFYGDKDAMGAVVKFLTQLLAAGGDDEDSKKNAEAQL